MRSIIWIVTVTLFFATDNTQLVSGYSAKPVVRRRCERCAFLTGNVGRRFIHQTALSSSTQMLPTIESASSTNEFSLGKPFSGLVADFKRRLPHYKSDWTDGFRKKSLAAILFLYFACLGKYVALFCWLMLAVIRFLHCLPLDAFNQIETHAIAMTHASYHNRVIVMSS
jgi:HCO3- transporter family